MNIRVFLSEVAGSNEADIEEMEKYLTSKQPFGLACKRSMIIFMPDKEKAYWLWPDHSAGPTFQAKGWQDFLDTVKMQYLSHKKVLSTDEILAVTSILKYERQRKQLAAVRKGLLLKPGDQAGPVGTGDKGVQPGESTGAKILQLTGGPTHAIILPESIRDAEDVSFDEGKDGPVAGG